jgi:hypothetical protein
MQEASLSLPDQIEAARASLPRMSAAGRARLAPLMERLSSVDGDSFFDFVSDRVIAGLVDLARRR